MYVQSIKTAWIQVQRKNQNRGAETRNVAIHTLLMWEGVIKLARSPAPICAQNLGIATLTAARAKVVYCGHS